MPKAPNANSGRQRILQTLSDSNVAMAPNDIKLALVERGFDVKYISSHLSSFKTDGKVEHLESEGKYLITQKGRDGLAKPAAPKATEPALA